MITEGVKPMWKEAIVFYDKELRRSEMARLYEFGEDEVWIAESTILWEDTEAREILLPLWVIEAKGLEEYIK